MCCKKCVEKTLFHIAKTQKLLCLGWDKTRSTCIVKLRYNFDLLIRTPNYEKHHGPVVGETGSKSSSMKERLWVWYLICLYLWVTQLTTKVVCHLCKTIAIMCFYRARTLKLLAVVLVGYMFNIGFLLICHIKKYI